MNPDTSPSTGTPETDYTLELVFNETGKTLVGVGWFGPGGVVLDYCFSSLNLHPLNQAATRIRVRLPAVHCETLYQLVRNGLQRYRQLVPEFLQMMIGGVDSDDGDPSETLNMPPATQEQTDEQPE